MGNPYWDNPHVTSALIDVVRLVVYSQPNLRYGWLSQHVAVGSMIFVVGHSSSRHDWVLGSFLPPTCGQFRGSKRVGHGSTMDQVWMVSAPTDILTYTNRMQQKNAFIQKIKQNMPTDPPEVPHNYPKHLPVAMERRDKEPAWVAGGFFHPGIPAQARSIAWLSTNFIDANPVEWSVDETLNWLVVLNMFP